MAPRTDRRDLTVFAVLAVLALVYSVLQANFPFLRSVVALFLVYLLWRFVRAHERIAEALEPPADARGSED